MAKDDGYSSAVPVQQIKNKREWPRMMEIQFKRCAALSELRHQTHSVTSLFGEQTLQ